MKQRTNRIVVFDLGGVLVRICRTWEEACRRAGVDVRAGWEDAALREACLQLSCAYQVGAVGTEEYFTRMAERGGGLYSPEEIRRVHDAWIVEDYSGVVELIDEIHEAGVPTGVLSNTNAAHWERLAGGVNGVAEFRAPGRVRHPHASHLLRAAKPALESYRAFEASVGVTAAQGAEIIFFDDLEENIAGAMRAGWRGHVVDHRGDTAAQMRAALRDAGLL